MTNLEIRAFLDSVDAETVSPRRKEMTDRSPVKLANESALMVYRFTWTSADGARMEVQCTTFARRFLLSSAMNRRGSHDDG